MLTGLTANGVMLFIAILLQMAAALIALLLLPGNKKRVMWIVESPDQITFLRSLGCDQAQGYFYHRPMPAEDLADALLSNNPDLEILAN